MNELDRGDTVIPRVTQDRINIVLPMAGLGSRFSQAGYRDPKPFIRVNSIPMIDLVLANVTSGFCTDRINLFLIINPAHYQMLQATGILDVPCVSVIACDPRGGRGAAVNVLRAAAFIDNDTPLMIANSDQWMRFDPLHWYFDMINKMVDGSILVFENDNPKWSYADIDSLGNVSRVAEKKVISKWATCGAYLYRRGSDFVAAATKMINLDERVNGEFYVCPAYNKMILCMNRKIIAYTVQDMLGMGTPEDFEQSIKELQYKELRGFSQRA